VARFVGSDRALKRLSLTTVAELPHEEGSAERTVARTVTARDALSLILASGGAPVGIEGGGVITLEAITRLLAQEVKA
jgi:osmoprotectant transport system ATP-binding protein